MALTVDLALQGGASLCAFSAGVLTSLINEPNIHIRNITGTSGGAMNGAAVTQAFNRHGYNHLAREEAKNRLSMIWNKIMEHSPSYPAHNFVQKNVLPIYRPFVTQHIDVMNGMFNAMNRMAYDTMKVNRVAEHCMSFHMTRALYDLIDEIVDDLDALQSQENVSLIVNAVDSEGHEKLFFGDALNAKPLLASAALQPEFRMVEIDDHYYKDGAYLGGSNPPLNPLFLTEKPADAVIVINTNIPHKPIKVMDQKDITAEDIHGTDDLILHQAYGHQALYLKKFEDGYDVPPLHVIMPQIDLPFTKKDKQDTSPSFIGSLGRHGEVIGQDFLRAHLSHMHKKPNLSFLDLKRMAQQNGSYPNPPRQRLRVA